MSEWVTPERWARLREELDGNYFIRDAILNGDQITDCALGVDDAARLHLTIRVPDDDDVLPPDLHDITIRYADSDYLFVDVSADASLESIISPIYDAIIRGCLDGRRAVPVITDQLESIRKAFSRAGLEISENKQIGLVGEMLVMQLILIPTLGINASSKWSGPFAEKHDFVGNYAHIEVKSTTKSMDQHEISRIDQLRAPNGKRLLLVSVQLERSIAGEYTIATIRNSINLALGHDGPALNTFEEKLKAMGWHEGLIQSGTLLRFNLRSLAVFAVEGMFPRLPDDYVPPRGVVALSYTINVSACPMMRPEQVVEIVRCM